MPKVSVIVPVYNVEKYLEQCLDSVINQTLKDIEIICINDGSTDTSLEILNKYVQKDKRIRIINQKNQGISTSRNNGINIASGEFIGFLDSDDYISPNFFEKLYNTAIKYKCDIAASDIIIVNGNNSYKNLIKYTKIKVENKTYKKYKLSYIPKHNYVWNKIYNLKKIKKAQLFFEENILYENIMFSHKIIHYLKSLVSVPNAKYFYRNNPYSTVNCNSEDTISYFNQECKKALLFVQQNNIKIIDYNKYQIYKWDKKVSLSIFNFPILVMKKYGNALCFYLFGFIPIFQYYNQER